MAIKQDSKGKWAVHVHRKGIPRVRRGGFESEEAASLFEREYLRKYHCRVGQTKDNRSLNDLIEIWYVSHGIYLKGGKSRRRALLQLSREIGNPVASRLSAEQFIAYRYKKRKCGDARACQSLNNLHDELIAIFNRLNNLRVIDYTSPICELEMIKA